MDQNKDDIQELAKLMDGFQFAMMTTTSARDGSLRSHPMTLQQVEFDGELWFFASRSNSPAVDIDVYPLVNLAFAEPGKNLYISLKARAELVHDPKKAEELWNPMFKTWFKDGLADPDLILIRVDVQSADYWKSPESKAAQLIGFTKAILTGRHARELGHHERIENPHH